MAVLAFVALGQAGTAQADALSIALLTDRSDAEELAGALGVELSPVIQRVVVGEGPFGTPDAMRRARDLDVDFGVWIDLIDGGLAVRVVDTLTWDVRTAPITGAVDAGAVAIMAASLVDELIEPPPRPPPAPPRTRRLHLAGVDRDYILTTHGSYELEVRDHASASPRTAIRPRSRATMNDAGRTILRLAVDGGFSTIGSTHFGVGRNVTRTFRLGVLFRLGGGFDGLATSTEVEVAYQKDARHGRLSVGLRGGPDVRWMRPQENWREGDENALGVIVTSFISFMWDVGRSNAVGFGFDLGMSFFADANSLPQARTGFLWETGS
ncbi:MAG: hypothetical protein JRH11_19360 [Deltaproteobacteria bacterium]|nr:hypothetical protein [Deltaproteobacteria bacterium]